MLAAFSGVVTLAGDHRGELLPGGEVHAGLAHGLEPADKFVGPVAIAVGKFSFGRRGQHRHLVVKGLDLLRDEEVLIGDLAIGDAG